LFPCVGGTPHFRLMLFCALLAACALAVAQPAPVLTWITNSSVKLELIIGDIDGEANAQGSNLLTALECALHARPGLQATSCRSCDIGKGSPLASRVNP
jgi:hypothetical protein